MMEGEDPLCGEDGPYEALLHMHRQEKKELQARITAMRKAAKNDKTKKKELATEIVRLENELEKRHKKHLDDITVKPCVAENTEATEDLESELAKVKVSKAQKRRDKKEKDEKERQELIKKQEKDNIHGPRNIENQAILTKLKKNNLKLHTIPSDGDCLYKAVSHQMRLTRDKTYSVQELRNEVASFMKSHKDDFISFMCNPETCEMLTNTEFEEYCDKIADTKVWGGQLEIRALSSILKCPINVIQATGPESIEQGAEFEGPPLIITYHRHMFGLGEHYNSTEAKVDEEENDSLSEDI